MSIVGSLAKRTALYTGKKLLGWGKRRAVAFGLNLSRRIWARRGSLFRSMRHRGAERTPPPGGGARRSPFTATEPQSERARGLFARASGLLTLPLRRGPLPLAGGLLRRGVGSVRARFSSGDPLDAPPSLLDRARAKTLALARRAKAGVHEFASDRAARALTRTFDVLGLTLDVSRPKGGKP